MRTPRHRLALAAAVSVLALAGAGCSSDDESSPVRAEDLNTPTGPACGALPAEGPGSFGALAELPAASAAASSKVLTTLATAVSEADLVDTLDGDGPFTVFAPVNSAFGEIPADQLEALLADREQLTSVLTYHVVEGDMTEQDLVDAGTVESVEGGELTIEGDADEFTVDGAEVVCGGIEVANGTVYVIDEVLTPGS
jgi:uncharacterized surface protein with fasciclin (FAS1) repeats